MRAHPVKTRILVIEVPDTRAEDLLDMAVQLWNESTDERDHVRHRKMFSSPAGDWEDK